MSIEQIPVEILGRRFTIGTPDSERDTLLKAVELLNSKIAAIQKAGRNMETEKVVIMAALNLTHDLLKSSSQHQNQDTPLSDKDFDSRIASLIQLCDSTLQHS